MGIAENVSYDPRGLLLSEAKLSAAPGEIVELKQNSAFPQHTYVGHVLRRHDARQKLVSKPLNDPQSRTIQFKDCRSRISRQMNFGNFLIRKVFPETDSRLFGIRQPCLHAAACKVHSGYSYGNPHDDQRHKYGQTHF